MHISAIKVLPPSRRVPRQHQALYAVVFLLALFVLFEWRASTSYEAFIIVTPEEDQTIGIGPPSSELFGFGELPQGEAATENLILQNERAVPTRISIVPMGGMRQFMRVSDAFFLLDPGDGKDVEFTMAVPGTARSKAYTGRVLIIRTSWIPWL